MAFEAWLLIVDLNVLANIKPKRTGARHRAVSLRQHGFLINRRSDIRIG